MSFSQTWLAVKGKSPALIWETLGLQGSGEYEDFPESPFASAMLPGGWCLVVANDDLELTQESRIKKLSGDCEVITCLVEEHAMMSYLESWQHGKLVWCVLHEGEQDREHLETEGDLPPIFTEIRATLFAEQKEAGGRNADVDYLFDIPTELGKALVGYKHDDVIEGLQFEILKPTHSKQPFWNRLFGN